MAGSPYAIIASGAVGIGSCQLHDHLCQRQPDRHPGGVDDHRQQHDEDLRADRDLAGTAFTTTGLVNSDTVSSVSETSTARWRQRLWRDRRMRSSSPAVGSGLANYTITYANGNLTVTPAPLTITANSTTQDVRADGDIRRYRFTDDGLVNSDSVSSVSETSTGAAATAVVAGSPYAIIAPARSARAWPTTRSPTSTAA